MTPGHPAAYQSARRGRPMAGDLWSARSDGETAGGPRRNGGPAPGKWRNRPQRVGPIRACCLWGIFIVKTRRNEA